MTEGRIIKSVKQICRNAFKTADGDLMFRILLPDTAACYCGVINNNKFLPVLRHAFHQFKQLPVKSINRVGEGIFMIMLTFSILCRQICSADKGHRPAEGADLPAVILKRKNQALQQWSAVLFELNPGNRMTVDKLQQSPGHPETGGGVMIAGGQDHLQLRTAAVKADKKAVEHLLTVNRRIGGVKNIPGHNQCINLFGFNRPLQKIKKTSVFIFPAVVIKCTAEMPV